MPWSRGCFVVNATGWLTDEQIATIAPGSPLSASRRMHNAIISPEGVHLCPPIREGEGMAIADLDFNLITKRKRMMDSVGHYARPELLSLHIDDRPARASVRRSFPEPFGFNPRSGDFRWRRRKQQRR